MVSCSHPPLKGNRCKIAGSAIVLGFLKSILDQSVVEEIINTLFTDL